MMSSNPVIGTDIQHSLRDGVFRITLNRPDAANAITAEQRAALIELLAAADRNVEARVVLIDSTGKHFCSGADVRNLQSGQPGADGKPTPVHAGQGMLKLLHGTPRLIPALIECGKPIVCAVQGTAAGLGAHIAYACDLVIAADNAVFIEAFVPRGMTVDAGGAWLLPRRVGLQKAKELIFFGDKLPAPEAARLGLVNWVVAADQLAAEAEKIVARLAKAPTLAISLSKRQLNRAHEKDLHGCLLDEAICQEICSTSHDSREGVASFMERREPQFKGY